MRITNIDYRDYTKPTRKLANVTLAKTTEKAVAYVNVVNETMVENFGNRVARPWRIYKPLVIEALRRKGLKDFTLHWSQSAGCTMCPCSPGFLIRRNGKPILGLRVYVTLDGAPTVTRKGAKQAAHRMAQLLQQI